MDVTHVYLLIETGPCTHTSERWSDDVSSAGHSQCHSKEQTLPVRSTYKTRTKFETFCFVQEQVFVTRSSRGMQPFQT